MIAAVIFAAAIFSGPLLVFCLPIRATGACVSGVKYRYHCNFSPSSFQVGNNITGDVGKLRKDFPDLEGDVANWSELTSLTPRPTGKRRLADLVMMVSGKYMDKDRGGGALADWTADSFSHDELLYASSDAWAGLFVWDALERKKGGLVASFESEQPTPGGGDRVPGGGDGVPATGAREPGTAPGVGTDQSEEAPGDPEVDESLGRMGNRSFAELPEEVRDDVEAGRAPDDWLTSIDDDADDGGVQDDDDDDVDDTPPRGTPFFHQIICAVANVAASSKHCCIIGWACCVRFHCGGAILAAA